MATLQQIYILGLQETARPDLSMFSCKHSIHGYSKRSAFLQACWAAAARMLQHIGYVSAFCLDYMARATTLCRHLGAFYSHGEGAETPTAGCF